MKVDFKWKKPLHKIAEEKTGGREGALFLAQNAKRLMDPYVPADNMVLSQNVRVSAEGNRGYVHYLSPYAHYQWEGELYVDPKTGKGAFTNGEGLFWSRPDVAKVPSGRKLEYSDFRHPLATSHWEEAMWTARKGDLVRAFDEYLKGRES